MNDEIKEILDRIETASEIFDCLLKPEECTELLDYITNLQREIERQSKAQVILDNMLADYKSCCEKASDKLGNYKHYSTPTEEQNSENEDIVDSALNILQNGSDKE